MRMAQADGNFRDAVRLGNGFRATVQKNFGTSVFVADNFNFGRSRENTRAQRLKKSLLGGKSCGVGGGGIFSATFALSLFNFGEYKSLEIFSTASLFDACNFNDVRAESANHFVTKSVSDDPR